MCIQFGRVSLISYCVKSGRGRLIKNLTIIALNFKCLLVGRHYMEVHNGEVRTVSVACSQGRSCRMACADGR